LAAALSGNRKEAYDILSILLTQRMLLAEIYDTIVMETMATIGRMWVQKKIGVEKEHLASNTALHAISKLQTSVPRKPLNDKIALCACLVEEYHELGITCINNILESEGWTTYYLGANVPLDSLIDAIESLSPDLVCVSSTLPQKKGSFIKDCRAVAESARQHGARIMFGGRALQDARIRRQISASDSPASASEFISFLKSNYS
jgi:methanogenic corrinoid protein MtbC1